MDQQKRTKRLCQRKVHRRCIIALWEDIEYVEESNQDFLLFKIDFEKSYDKLEWNLILQSLQDMDLNPTFISMVATLFDNARSRILVNESLIAPFKLAKSIR